MGFLKLLCQIARKGLLFFILNLAQCVAHTRMVLPFKGIEFGCPSQLYSIISRN